MATKIAKKQSKLMVSSLISLQNFDIGSFRTKNNWKLTVLSPKITRILYIY